MYSDEEYLYSIKNAVKDKNLTEAALKLYLTIRLFHDCETISIAELQSATGQGRDKLNHAIEVLIHQGYIKRNRSNNELGQFSNYSYETFK